MKNVAATNGQSVSFAALFFGVESTWEGIWAGTDMLLNLYSRSPWAQFALELAGEQTRNGRIQNLHAHATKKVFSRQNILHRRRLLDGVPIRSGRGFPVIDSPPFPSILILLEPSLMKLIRLSALAVLALPVVGLFAQQPAPTPRPIAIADYFQIHDVSDPQISADGQWIAYSV